MAEVNPWIMFVGLICIWPLIVAMPLAWLAYNRGRGRRFGFYDAGDPARAAIGYARADAPGPRAPAHQAPAQQRAQPRRPRVIDTADPGQLETLHPGE